MTSEPLHLFINPTAGRGRAGTRLPRIEALLQANGAALVVHKTTAPGDLERDVRRVVDEGIRRVLVAGGDGSVHDAANGILSAQATASLGIIPTGTANDFAKSAGIPLDWQAATTLLTKRIASNAPTRPIDAGRMNDRYFINGAGIGLDAKITAVARSIRWPIGDLVYLVAVFRTLLEPIATPTLRIRAEEDVWNGPLTLVSIANGVWIGGKFRIAPSALIDDGRFELLYATPVTRRRLLTLLPKLARGDHVGEPEVTRRSVTALTIEADGPVPAHLDGEVQPAAAAFRIEVLPGALRLV